jgi:hypothetical protein
MNTYRVSLNHGPKTPNPLYWSISNSLGYGWIPVVLSLIGNVEVLSLSVCLFVCLSLHLLFNSEHFILQLYLIGPVFCIQHF